MVFIVTFLVCVLLSWGLFFLWKEKKWLWMCTKFYRDPWNFPVVGNAIVWTQEGQARMDLFVRFGRISLKNGGLAGMWLGPKYFVVVSDANVAASILKTCLAKDDILNVSQELLGYGSIFAPVQIWRNRRKVIAPTFSMKNLNQFVEVFQQQSSIMVEHLQKPAGKGTFSIWKYLTPYTMDSVCETALGEKVNVQHFPEHPVLQAFEELLKLFAQRLILPATAQKAYTYLPIYKLFKRYIHVMHVFVDDIINAKRKQLVEMEEQCQQCNDNDSEATKLKTFLELFIQTSGGSSGFTNKELREEALVLLLAGTDTSAVGSAFTCLMLARHPEVQEKVYDEMKKVLGDVKTPITSKDLPRMKYLEAVVKESLRLYPPVPVIVRKVEKDFQLPSGQTLVVGTAVMLNIWAIHRNPQYWGYDAEEFRPDRFIGATDIHPAAYIPFSHGPRSCLGYQYAMMSMKTAIANLIRHYCIHPALPVLDKNAPLRISFDIMMKHVDNFQLKLQARD